MNNNQENSLFQISRNLFSLALPMASVQFITIASVFLCMVMLSKLGHEVLAASALFFSAQITVMVTGMSILFSLSILIGHAFGARDYLKIGNYVQQGWSLSIILSIPMILIFWNIQPILIFFKQNPDIAKLAREYFHAYLWGVLPLLFAVCNQQLCYGIRKQYIVTITNLLCVVILLSTSYVLIFGKFGFPKFGVIGLGYAIAVQNWFYFLFTTFCFYKINEFKKFNLFSYRVHQHLHHFKEMLKVGWPICFQMSGEMFSFFASAAMIGWLGATSLAAFQVINQYLFLIVIPLFALAQASGVLIGQAYGSKNYHLIRKTGTASIIFSLIVTSIVAIIFLTAPRILAMPYLNVDDPHNVETLQYITSLFAVIAIMQIFDGVRNVLTGGLRGLLDTKYPMYVGLLSLWLIGIPCSYLFAFTFNMGVVGIALGSTCGMLLGAMMLVYRWNTTSFNHVSKHVWT